MASRKSGRRILIALGSNVPGAWGAPIQTLDTACSRLSQVGIAVRAVSTYFMTPAVGGGRQPAFVNAVVDGVTTAPPATLLRHLKKMERAAGRRSGRHWGPRPLDIDIIDVGVVVGQPARGRRPAGRISLPHPEMHRRAFVLVPLLQVAPHWWHPRLKCHARVLLQQPAVVLQRRSVRPVPRDARCIAALRRTLDL
jgi:2-amino-4-hydroxy-6-hydroxymethyldihydropteridine diphosphokinase